MATARSEIAIVHDYLTQRGGAERVVLALCRAFPGAPVHTSMYHPEGTFPEFRDIDVRVSWLDAVPGLRRRHRAAFPLLRDAFDRMVVDADVAVASSSGWAHGATVTGRKVVYCHTPARWLYHSVGYLRRSQFGRRLVLDATRHSLMQWDRRAALSAHRYLCNSALVARRVHDAYGLAAEVIPPPPALGPDGPESSLAGLEPGYLLTVSRLLPYKNVAATVAAARATGSRLVVVGTGPEAGRLRAAAGDGTLFTGAVTDDRLRWLYRNCAALICAGFEDFGLAPLEAAAFGVPTLALRAGGYLETVIEGVTGFFFDSASPESISAAIERADVHSWDRERLRAIARTYAEDRFIQRIQAAVLTVPGLA